MSEKREDRRSQPGGGDRSSPEPARERQPVGSPADIRASIGAEALHAIGAHHFDGYTTNDGQRIVLRFHIPSATPARRALAVAANLRDHTFTVVPAYVLYDDSSPGGGPDVYSVAHGHTATCASEDLPRAVQDVVAAWHTR
ncbi:hypothetical protein [Nonomuraea sp. NPDC049400]|uniref:hypothetical protein n=1 Tax=Nonomuraea sp. NPDC049400 TaxID=3364352 RepID=UPI0037B8C5F1